MSHGAMVDFTIIAGVIGALAAFGFSVLYTQLRTPEVKISKKTTNFTLTEFPIDTALLSGNPSPGQTKTTVVAYRVSVANRQKRALNAAAKNCMAWLELDGAIERYQLSWVGTFPTVVINVGDQREIDLCGHLANIGLIIGPTENGYLSNPRILGRRDAHLKGWLWVTSENAKKDRVRIQIETNKQCDGLDVSFPEF